MHRIHARNFRPIAAVFLLAAAVLPLAAFPPVRAGDEFVRYEKGYRWPKKNGWITVHLEGTPSEIGFQHGVLLYREIAEVQRIVALTLEHDTKKDWQFFRKAAETVLWPKVDPEYREEIQGITDGLHSKGMHLDLWDVAALNGWLELGSYYVPMLEKKKGEPPSGTVPERCSAFIATGSYTTSGGIVIGHNTWTGYMDGAHWNIVFDVLPTTGHRFVMDGMPGMIHSGDDFGINASGLLITETTISHFEGFDPEGVPEFNRARKAMQYSGSIDDFARIMTEGNNGGYANNWLVGDRKTGEIASLELGLKNVTLRRTSDGYFSGANYPVNEKLAAEETTFPVNDPAESANARRTRWEQIMSEWKGRIDVDAGQRFLGDSIDPITGQDDPNERTLCGRIDLSPRGISGWQPPFGLAGAVSNKVTSSAMAEKLSFSAALGPQCGPPFKASQHLRKYPSARWTKLFLKDFPKREWTLLSAGDGSEPPQPPPVTAGSPQRKGAGNTRSWRRRKQPSSPPAPADEPSPVSAGSSAQRL